MVNTTRRRAVITERTSAALAIAALPTKARIREDLAAVPESFWPFAYYFHDHLFDTDLSVEKAKAKTAYRDNSASTQFDDHIGATAWDYVTDRRLEVALRLLCEHEIGVGQAALAVGFESDQAFRRAFKKRYGYPPSEAPARRARPASEVPGPPPGMDDWRAWERWEAAMLWQQIRGRPYEKQQELAGSYLFRSTALFDLLRQKSREEGRKDRQAGIRLAELALHSLHYCAEARGERKADLWAEGKACLGNALRLAMDLPRSDAELAVAWTSWRSSGPNPDPRVGAVVYVNQGSLRMIQRRHGEALELIGKSLPLFEEAGDVKGRIEALIQHGAVNVYMDRLEAAYSDLQTASELTAEVEDPFLSYHAEYNLLNVKARRGNYRDALDALDRLKSACEQLNYPGGKCEIQHLEGNIKEEMGDYAAAEERYSEAHDGFTELKQWRGGAMAAFDLAVVYARQAKNEDVLRLASDLIPVLESLQLHPETLASVRLLSKAVAEMKVTHALLCSVREKLRKDPLLQLSLDKHGREASRPLEMQLSPGDPTTEQNRP